MLSVVEAFTGFFSRIILILSLASVPFIKPAQAASSWQEDWERVNQAAKKEGKVSVVGFLAREVREVLTQPFEKKFGISVDYLAVSGPETPPKIGAERKAGQYLWDIFVGGTTTTLTAMEPQGMLEPLEANFILPEIKEPKNWYGGSPEFVDEGRQILIMIRRQRGTFFVNPGAVNAKSIRSYKELLEPKWKKKIVVHDPRVAGPGQATFTFFFLHPELGANFIRALALQEPLILRDHRQEADAVGQGRYPILLGGNEATVEELIKQGVQLAIVEPRQLREGSDISPGFGALSLFNRQAHPNAAKVYINWLLSKDGQTEFSRATGYVSGRVDVPSDHVAPWRVPIAGSVKNERQRAAGCVIARGVAALGGNNYGASRLESMA
jgi:iron(III) transport system substrate-binding protein